VLSAIGVSAYISSTIWSEKASFARAGFGSAIAIRVGIVATSWAFARALGGFDDSRKITTHVIFN
jgi:hypothetical protein